MGNRPFRPLNASIAARPRERFGYSAGAASRLRIHALPLDKKSRSLALVASTLLLAASLSACGRRGPLELPPDVQARGAALRAEDEARAAHASHGARPKLSEEGAGDKKPQAIPGTVGHRPPQDYPFSLDPLL